MMIGGISSNKVGRGTVITSGSSYTTPGNITSDTYFKFILVGGGGGGGGIDTTNGKGSGGGGGATCILFITGLSPSTSYTISIGSGGAGGVLTGAPTDGGDTTLTIGPTTYTAGGGVKGKSSLFSTGGTGGVATNGSINRAGQDGMLSTSASTTTSSGRGGASWIGEGGASIYNAGNGNPGKDYGGGGGGGSGLGATGGAGANGVIIVEVM